VRPAAPSRCRQSGAGDKECPQNRRRENRENQDTVPNAPPRHHAIGRRQMPTPPQHSQAQPAECRGTAQVRRNAARRCCLSPAARHVQRMPLRRPPRLRGTARARRRRAARSAAAPFRRPKVRSASGSQAPAPTRMRQPPAARAASCSGGAAGEGGGGQHAARGKAPPVPAQPTSLMYIVIEIAA